MKVEKDLVHVSALPTGMWVKEHESLTPREIVGELDKYIIGQDNAKRSVAIALRNRWRRQHLPEELRDEVAPKNIIMIGPTGVGKTEIARRLARLTQAPLIKVEASKFTEVGYVGRDVESIIRDLTELAVKIVKDEEMISIQFKARELAEERLVDILLPTSGEKIGKTNEHHEGDNKALPPVQDMRHTKEKLYNLLKKGKLDDRMVELEVQDRSFPMVEIFSTSGIEEMDINFKDVLGNLLPKRTKKKKVKVRDAVEILRQEEANKLVDMDKVTRKALERVENAGIVFLDEIDKISGRETAHGPDVSREGVQRDLLPIIEGSTVQTKYGMVKTDHVLFIAAGAFHASKPSDLIPELQGRFPIRVELNSLGVNEFIRILTEPRNALIKQYIALMETEDVQLEFRPDAIKRIAKVATMVNEKTENIGARRLHTIMERLLEEISFDAPYMGKSKMVIDTRYVDKRLKNIVEDVDLSRYIL